MAIMISDLSKSYEIGDSRLEVLKELCFDLEKGEFTSISGPSGSGKTTLLNIVAGIDNPTDGKVTVLGEEISSKDEDFLARFRCNNVGFVFQTYNLISTLTVSENIAFPMEWARKPQREVATRVKELLSLVGLEQRANHFPFQLSGGEQQRVAFARALANDPQLLLVDEPTGNLDPETSQTILEMLQKLRDGRKTIIVATHDERILKLAEKRFRLESGKLECENE